MSRTPEQIAADDNLTAAIEAQQRAYHDDNEGVLTEYVIVSERTYWDGDGDRVTATYLSVRDNGVIISHQLGLLHFAAAKVQASIAEDGE